MRGRKGELAKLAELAPVNSSACADCGVHTHLFIKGTKGRRKG